MRLWFTLSMSNICVYRYILLTQNVCDNSQMIIIACTTQESKDQNVELNCQLEALKLEVMGEGHQRSGNSLFGEVDNRRMEIERKLISLKVRHETLEKTHATTQHQLRKMKVHCTSKCP